MDIKQHERRLAAIGPTAGMAVMQADKSASAIRKGRAGDNARAR
jgi:hypothetical protein